MEQGVESRRDLAIKRLKAKNDFKIHVVTYLTINAMLVVIWLVSAVMLGGGFRFFWPVLPIAIWGAGLIIHAYSVYGSDVYSEEQIQREMKALP